MTTVHYPREIRQISKQGKALFEKLAPELRERYYGNFVAIEVDSGDYFIGETEIDANKKARTKYPGKVFYLGRIGYRAASQFKGHVPVQFGGRR